MTRLVEVAREQPETVAAMTDLDGTLAAIRPRPEDVSLTDEMARALEACAGRLGLVAVITGRPAVEARNLVGLEQLHYRGNHGLEAIDAGTSEVEIHSGLRDRGREAAEFVESLDPEEMDAMELRVEDKGPIVALHWRGSSREAEAERFIATVASKAEAAGLIARPGKKVLELRPVDSVDKGTAVRELIGSESGISQALFVGDDLTDLDAFAALDALVAEGTLEVGVKVAVDSPETVDSGMVSAADLLVDGTEGVCELLGLLSD